MFGTVTLSRYYSTSVTNISNYDESILILQKKVFYLNILKIFQRKVLNSFKWNSQRKVNRIMTHLFDSFSVRSLEKNSFVVYWVCFSLSLWTQNFFLIHLYIFCNKINKMISVSVNLNTIIWHIEILIHVETL